MNSAPADCEGWNATGKDISTRAMIDYFKPLMSWLEEQNKRRQIGWE
jgi:peptidyl-dipeptidase A